MAAHESLDNLFKKYELNEYMLNRINTHMMTILPNTLELEQEHYNMRINRTSALQSMQEMFIKVFLDKHKYYFLQASGLYYEYIDDSYCVRREDDIQYKLLSTISEDRTLMDWKYKTKFNIIRQIKDRNLLASTPNTETIQKVLTSIYPAFFPSKNAAKYFLTIIGDNILKKQTPIRVINKHTPILAGIDCISHLIGATNLTSNFASKYNDNHAYSQYRLLCVSEQFPSADLWQKTVLQLGLDLLCVASHYSNRYGSSEEFNADEELKSHIMRFNVNSQESIVSQFIQHSTQPADGSFKISWKQLHYIWNQYLASEALPNMMYSNTLKQHLKQQLQYDESSDTFIHITSQFLPNIRRFLQFMTDNVKPSEEELEIGELQLLYGSSTMKEAEILKLVMHFFPEIVVDEYKYNKYVLHAECQLWNKKLGIDTMIEGCRTTITDIISIDNLYEKYTSTGGLVVSKQYFEKYIRHRLCNCIVYDTFIKF